MKRQNSAGVCSISSNSNGSRQDWLVCPYRVINSDIVRDGCRRIFALDHDVVPVPVTLLKKPGELDRFKAQVLANGTGYLFFQDKLGGEISVIGTSRSPELAFDVTLVEVRPKAEGGFEVSRFGILEIQTMDFHGTYKHAVSNLRDGLRLHPENFVKILRENGNWLSDHVEGPNIANVFKRTFYQVMLKFKLSGEGSVAAGTILALPKSVWDSWQPFLGAPELELESPRVMRFKAPKSAAAEAPLNAFICVFDLDASDTAPISPLRIEHFVRVSPARLAHYAFSEVPENILQAIQSSGSLLARIKARLGVHWPEMDPSQKPARGRKLKT